MLYYRPAGIPRSPLLSTEPSTVEPLSQEFLWADAAPFDALFEQRVSALAAVHATLEERRPLAGREDGFLALYAFARDVDAETFATVWSSPAAEAWTRRAFDALRACLAAPDEAPTAKVLSSHLDAFALFALALAHLADVELRLPEPLHVDPPVNLPGTPLVISGAATQTIGGRADLELMERPIVHLDGCELTCAPEALHVPGAAWSDIEAALAAGPAFQAAHVDTLGAALALIRTHQPQTFAQIREHISVVALQPEDADKYPNATSSEHPGAMLLGAYGDAIELADHLVHEFYHGRLFALEALGPLLEEDEAPSERFYSPWRDEPRSMRGLLHGTYVFTPVHDYWRAVERDASLPSDTRELARDRATRIALQLRLACTQIQRHGSLTAFGRSLFSALQTRVDEVTEARDGDAYPPARNAVREHVRRFDHDGQVADVAV